MGEERLAAFLVLHGRSCMVVGGGGVAGGGEKKRESETSEGEAKFRKKNVLFCQLWTLIS